jgi:hypothetical protein
MIGYGARRLLSRRIEPRAIIGWAARHWIALVVAAGIGLRAAEFARGRDYWLDEGSLSVNITGHAPFEAPSPLENAQLVPFGFLVVERALAFVFGGSRWVLRLLPFAASLAALPLFVAVARRVVSGRALVAALVLFATSDPLIYFAAELKPYAVDVAAALAAYWLAADLDAGWTVRRAVRAALLGAALVWLSFPVVFVLSAVGMVGLVRSRQAWRGWIAIGAVWLASFAGSQIAARRLLGPGSGMRVFWEFAFPATWFDVPGWMLRRLASLFGNPMHFDTPFGPTVSALIGAVLALIGAVSLASRQPVWLVRLVGPIALAMVAGLLRAYPFHGRLLLFLVPALYLLLAEGLDAIARRVPGTWGPRLLVAAALAWPVGLAALHVVEPAERKFHPQGDLRPNPFP